MLTIEGMSKQRNRVLPLARFIMRLAGEYLQPYSCAKSRHTFTQPQLMTCLILRAYLRSTYRGVIEVVRASEKLQETMGLRKLPNYSTLKYFADRVGTTEIVAAMLGEAAKRFRQASEPVAVDLTGLDVAADTSSSPTHRGRRRRKCVKLTMVLLCGSMMPAGMASGRVPCNDLTDALAPPVNRLALPETVLVGTLSGDRCRGDA